MRTLRTGEAATYLNVSPNTLRAWELRFGFPRPRRSPGRHRLYSFAELVALRESLNNGLAVSSAVSAARDATTADEYTLTAALLGFDYQRADRALELGLSLRSFEDGVTQLLLPALCEIHAKAGAGSAPWEFASRWADAWLERVQRLASTQEAWPRVLFVNCSGYRTDVDAIHAHVLELLCVRAGGTALRLPVSAHGYLERAATAFAPGALVLSGRGAPDEQVACFARVVRSHARHVDFVHYRRAHHAVPHGAALSPSPVAARNEIIARLRARSGAAALTP